MPLPHRPSEFAALQINEGESFCSALKKLMKLSVYVWQHFAWKYQGYGSSPFGFEYSTMVCSIECPDPATDTTASTTSGNPPT
jgi:hypothetical protein